MSELSETGSDVRGEIERFFTRTLVRLQSRMESVEVKVGNLGKVVRLLQQYSEKKDQQYERETNNLQLFQGKLARMEEIEAQMGHYVQRFGDISLAAQSHSLKIEQMQRTMQERQQLVKEVEQRLGYELQQTNKKIERLELGLLQQIREGSKRQQEQKSKVTRNGDNYILEQINFKLSQLQNNHRADLQRMKKQIDRLQAQHKKPAKQSLTHYGLDALSPSLSPQPDKPKAPHRNKSSSQLKRVKSK